MSFKYYIILLIVWVCFSFPSDAFGQYILKETIPSSNGQKYAIIYSEGLAKSAQWNLGFKMAKGGATIRHQVSKGNDGNLSVNDRIPVRFIVAPTDVVNVNWMEAGGVTGGNGNLNADFAPTTADTGCRSYGKTAEGLGRKWRVPTQRELQLMWMFRIPVGIIYPNAPMENASIKNYWASTEKDADNAWVLDFMNGVPHCFWQLKTTVANVRCVSDY